LKKWRVASGERREKKKEKKRGKNNRRGRRRALSARKNAEGTEKKGKKNPHPENHKVQHPR
jgi:hypothetical protein